MTQPHFTEVYGLTQTLVFGPGNADGPGQRIEQPTAKAWQGWLFQQLIFGGEDVAFGRSEFLRACTRERLEQILGDIGQWRPMYVPRTDFPYVARLLDEGVLQARLLPPPAPSHSVEPERDTPMDKPRLQTQPEYRGPAAKPPNAEQPQSTDELTPGGDVGTIAPLEPNWFRDSPVGGAVNALVGGPATDVADLWRETVGDERCIGINPLTEQHEGVRKGSDRLMDWIPVPAAMVGMAARGLDEALDIGRRGSIPDRKALFSSKELADVERASPELLKAVGQKRAVTFAEEGSDALRFLDYRNAEAAAFGAEDMLLRENPSKAAVLEEFLHGTQQKLGIIDKIGRPASETHVKDFMIRHRTMLELNGEDVRRLKILKDMGL